MITTNMDYGRNFYVYTDDIKGEWSNPIYVRQGGIDPSLFFDQDGKVYLTSNGHDDGVQGIFQCEIDIHTGEALTKSRCIWYGTGGRFPEAPHLYKINDMYYLMIAEGGTEYGHMITIARSKDPYGHFESCPNNPILTHRNLGEHRIQGTGHGDLVQDEAGNWWMIFLGFRTTGPWMNFHHLGREVFLAPINWDKEGWPVVNETGTVDFNMELKNRKLPYRFRSENSEFLNEEKNNKTKSSALQWNYLRNPCMKNYKISNDYKEFSLKGTAVTLNDVDSPTFIGFRQKEFQCEFKCELLFNPKENGEEAGLTIIMDEKHHYEIAISRQWNINRIILRKTIGSLHAIVKDHVYENDSVILKIEGNELNYCFSFVNNTGESFEMGYGETRYLSSEVAKGFTGVYFGLYATGNGRDSTTEAVFRIK